MFFFWRNKPKPLEPRLEAVPTWNQLARIQGLGAKPNLNDILIVFARFAKLPFFGEPQKLSLETKDNLVVLLRCFGPEKGCLRISMELPVEQGVKLEQPLNQRRNFFSQVKRDPVISQIKRVPIEALIIHYDS